MTYCFEVKDRKGIIEYFYSAELPEWHSCTHKRGGNIEENVQATLDSMSDSSIMYVVNFDGKLGAFFMRYEDPNGLLVLEGFHVGKQFREADFLNEFWQLVKEKFGGSFITGIFAQNDSAFKHLIKQGFDVIKTIQSEGKEVYILQLKF